MNHIGGNYKIVRVFLKFSILCINIFIIEMFVIRKITNLQIIISDEFF